MNPALQRAYIYLVALVAVHMIVLGAANLMRVLAELALGAPSQTFIGLPFLFAEGLSAPRDLHREHASLAIALLLVGIPAWLIHWRAGQRAALRDREERASAWRSVYLHVVILVTTLLVAAHAAFAATHVVRGLMDPSAFETGRLGGPLGGPFGAPIADEHWLARAVGMLALVLAAAVAWRYHRRWSESDRAASVGGRAETIRVALFHLTLVIGGLFALQALAEAASWAIRAFIPESALRVPVVEGPPVAPGEQDLGRSAPPPRRPPPMTISYFPVVERLTDRIPAAIAFAALWLAHWIAAGKSSLRTDALRLGTRAQYLYIALAISGAFVLATGVMASQQLLNALIAGPPAELWLRLADPLPAAVVFAAAWAFHRWVSIRETDLATEPSQAAQARRPYLYAFSLVGVALAAIGTAGLLGVAGSYVLGDQTHQPEEIAFYLALVLFGLPAWVHHWRVAQAHVQIGGDPERRARWRRVALSLGVLGGVVTALAFGSGAVFRMVNALLAFEFGTVAAHDLWHLLSDTVVGGGVALFHWRALRADRLTPADALSQAPRAPALVVVLASPDPAARERLLAALSTDDVRVYESDAATISELERGLRRL